MALLLRFLFLLLGLELFFLFGQGDDAVDYAQALHKSFLFFEGQRSGKLPADQRIQWRGDSGLEDGKDAGVDLTGGYYDAGDNVKFGFPYAFTITMLAWSIAEYGSRLQEKNELGNAMTTLKWGTDYLIRAHAAPEVLYVEVGDGDSDHQCWQRPEDMTTPRNSYKIDASHPGSDVAAETAAAFAASSMAFNQSDPNYANVLLTHAEQLFQFANKYRGKYQDSIPVARNYYPSSGFHDEYQWAAVWLLAATKDKTYKDYLKNLRETGGVRSMFSWDDKWAGVQTMVTKLMIEQKLDREDGPWGKYESEMVQFICKIIQMEDENVTMSPGGMLWWDTWNNFQYTTAAMLLISAHADHLAAVEADLMCDKDKKVTPQQLIDFVSSQVDYILGANPEQMSYMVGFGTKYPGQPHHRGASMPSIKEDPKQIECKDGFKYFNSQEANLHVIEGAIVGGPNENDEYDDSRANYQQTEAPTVNTAPLVGVLARLA